MGQPFLGEVKLITWNFAPKNWALCNGQLLPINQNQALFSLLQTFYGGDGRVTFGLPDLRGRTGIHQGAGFTIGQKGGAQPYHGATNLVAMDPASITSVGGSQPHENRQPFLVINFIICLAGIFPSRN